MYLLKLQLERVLEVHILTVSSKALTYRFENCQIRCNKNFALKLMNIPIPRFSLKFWRVWSSSGTLNEIYAYIYLVFHLEEAFGFKKTHESCVRGYWAQSHPGCLCFTFYKKPKIFAHSCYLLLYIDETVLSKIFKFLAAWLFTWLFQYTEGNYQQHNNSNTHQCNSYRQQGDDSVFVLFWNLKRKEKRKRKVIH